MKAFICAGVALVSGSSLFPAQAQNPHFYAGKTLKVVIGYGPGAGYDLYGRLLTRHLGRFIPGAPTLVPNNMPGGGSLRSIGYLYNAAPRDGLEIGIFATSALLEPLYGRPEANFDPVKFTWIGNMDESVGTCAVWHTTGVKSLEELRTRPIIFGGSGPAGLNSQHAAALKNLLGLQIRLVQGYQGAANVKLAMPKGEVEGGCGFALSSLLSSHRSEYQSGELRPIVQTAIDKHPLLKGVPHLYDYAANEEMRQMFDLIFGAHVLGRPVAAPPGVPQPRARILQDAFRAMVKDAAFLAEAKKANLPVTPRDGEATAQLVTRFMSSPPAVVKKAAAAMRE
ncbi:MAG: hypothetical protein FJX29_04575 [Alphaproteobacteria bacterium]|nr:hypothetical protein [Alphaproteobacteria bacterium]